MNFMKKQNEMGKQKKIKKRYIVLGILLLLLAAVPLAAYGVFHSYYNKMNIQPIEPVDVTNSDVDNSDGYSDSLVLTEIDDDIDTNIEDSPEEEIKSYEDYLKENLEAQAEELPYDSKKVYNILLIGTDARYTDQASRSDTMIIISINRERKKIVMTSIMRDIYCTIPGIGNTRINHANAYGGVSLLLDTVEYNLGIHIDDYATINFYGFMDAVDAIGGVEMEVSAAEITEMNDWLNNLNDLLGQDRSTDKINESDAGTLLLNGKQTLVFSRIRYTGNSDFERTSRQRRVLEALLEKAKSLTLLELRNLMNAILPCVTTNLTQGEVLSLLLHAPEYFNYEVVSSRIPIDGSWWNLHVNGMAVLGIDFAENKKYWYELVYGEQI